MGISKLIAENLNEEVEMWENELDMLGTSANVNVYLEMLNKAPAGCRSQEVLTRHIQQIMSA